MPGTSHTTESKLRRSNTDTNTLRKSRGRSGSRCVTGPGACVRACACACARVRVRVCVCVCARARARELTHHEFGGDRCGGGGNVLRVPLNPTPKPLNPRTLRRREMRRRRQGAAGMAVSAVPEILKSQCPGILTTRNTHSADFRENIGLSRRFNGRVQDLGVLVSGLGHG